MAFKDQREPLRFPRTNGASASALGQAEQLAQPRANLIALLRKRAAMLARNEHDTEGHRGAARQQPKASTDEALVPEHPGALIYPPGLKRAFHEAISDIHSSRGTIPPTGAYALAVQDVGWRTFHGALVDSCSAIISERHPQCSWARNHPPSGNMHVLASAPGSGKSTLAKAFAIALTRVTLAKPFPLGCVFLVHHIATAEAVYQELSALLPRDSVAVFSTKHDADDADAAYAHKFQVGALDRYPVLITTQQFYMHIRGEQARYYRKNDLRFPRVVTFIDERVNEIAVYDADPLALEGVLKAIQQDDQAPRELQQGMLALLEFASTKRIGKDSIESRTHDGDGWQAAIKATQCLRIDEAARYARSASVRMPGVDFDAVFGFANAMADDRAFIARQNNGVVNFVGYERALPRLPGMVLLDATADIDGISKVCRWRKHPKMPPEGYDHLEVVHVPSVARGTLRRWLKNRPNMNAYIAQIRDLILRHVSPRQRALVVCTKDVVVAKNIENWSEHMVPFLNRTSPEGTEGTMRDTEFTNEFAWSLENRQIVVTWFGGYGIGANVWRDADVVIICDDFHLPQRAIKATLQGLKGHKATEGLLADPDDVWSDELEDLRDGHILRWMKQMALRGKAREMDQHGVCGHQKLVITGDLVRLLGHRPKVFPGAKIKSEPGEHSQWLDKLVCLLLHLRNRTNFPPR
jgi:hypothetical protein